MERTGVCNNSCLIVLLTTSSSFQLFIYLHNRLLAIEGGFIGGEEAGVAF